MHVIERDILEIEPYENNPRNNDDAVDKVAASIQAFGWQQPIVVDTDGVIIAGHTRYKAAKRLGMETVPVVVAEGLTDEQVRAYRLADNKTAELAGWNFELLDSELFNIDDIDMSAFGFDMDAFADGTASGNEWFNRRNRDDDSEEVGNEEYNEFLHKFDVKKTTDDCYTPDVVYDAVADWVVKEYGLSRDQFVRPFFPGGDYQRHKYEPDSVVVDNPPFSILAEILDFYTRMGIRFFLFSPGTSCIGSTMSRDVTTSSGY